MKLLQIKYPYHERDKKELFLTLEEKYNNTVSSDTKEARRTELDLHKNSFPTLTSLLEWESDLNLEISKYLCGGQDVHDKFIYGIAGTWAIQYKKDEGVITHNHFPYTYTCNYYLNLPENSAPLMIIPNGNKDKKDADPVEIEEGYMYVIPGWVHHYVENNEALNRTAIISNWMPLTQG
jgi:hypothetical protein